MKRTVRIGQLELAGREGNTEQDCQYRTVVTVLLDQDEEPGHDSQKRRARTGQSEWDKQKRTGRRRHAE
jgi:hypothetical protein